MNALVNPVDIVVLGKASNTSVIVFNKVRALMKTFGALLGDPNKCLLTQNRAYLQACHQSEQRVNLSETIRATYHLGGSELSMSVASYGSGGLFSKYLLS